MKLTQTLIGLVKIPNPCTWKGQNVLIIVHRMTTYIFFHFFFLQSEEEVLQPKLLSFLTLHFLCFYTVCFLPPNHNFLLCYQGDHHSSPESYQSSFLDDSKFLIIIKGSLAGEGVEDFPLPFTKSEGVQGVVDICLCGIPGQ